MKPTFFVIMSTMWCSPENVLEDYNEHIAVKKDKGNFSDVIRVIFPDNSTKQITVLDLCIKVYG